MIATPCWLVIATFLPVDPDEDAMSQTVTMFHVEQEATAAFNALENGAWRIELEEALELR